MVDPSGMRHRMKIKCIVSGCGYEKEVDNGIHLTEVEMFHQTRTGLVVFYMIIIDHSVNSFDDLKKIR
jgi:hypothetical protein